MVKNDRLTDIFRIGVPNQKNEHGVLGKSFFLDFKPESAVLRLTAEGPCAIYINGDFVQGHKGRLPNRVLCIEVSSRLKKGENEISVLSVAHYLQKTEKSMYEQRGAHFSTVAAELVAESKGEKTRIVTDSSWRCGDGTAVNLYGEISRRAYERFWLRAALWPEKRFDDDIPQAVKDVAGEDYLSYALRCDPEYAEPVSVLASDVLPALDPSLSRPDFLKDDEHFVIYDFGKIVVGYPVLEYSSSRDCSVSLYFDYNETPQDFIQMPKLIEMLSLKNVLSSDSDKKQWIRRRAARYVMAVFPADTDAFSLKGFKLRVSMLPSVRKGWFCCDDPELNRIWEVGKYTLQVNKHQEYESCPRNEMKFFSGDGIMDALVDYYAFGDFGLADASLSYTEPYICVGLRTDVFDRNAALWDYPAWRVIMSYNHYLHTGSKEFLSFYYKELCQLADWMLEKLGSDFLVSQHPVYFDVFFTVPDAVEYSCSEHRLGRKTYLNALFYKSFWCMAEFARAMDDVRAEEFEGYAKMIKNAINEKLFCQERSVYYDELSPELVPQEGNALAVLFKIADDERAERVLASLKKYNWSPWGSAIFNLPTKHTRHGNDTVSPLMCSYEAEARFLENDDKSAFELIRRCWGTMIKKGAETFWEFTPNHETKQWSIRAHSWSAGCTYLLSAYGAGIRPLNTGYEAVLFAPSAELNEFKCVVPTVKGYIAAKCQISQGVRSYLLAVPKGIKIKHLLPEGATIKILEY